jgi:hypothetical protein
MKRSFEMLIEASVAHIEFSDLINQDFSVLREYLEKDYHLFKENFKLLPEREQIVLLQKSDPDGQPFLWYLIENLDHQANHLEEFFSISCNNTYWNFEFHNQEGNNIFHFLAEKLCANSIKFLTHFLEKDLLYRLVNKQNIFGQAPFHKAMKPEGFLEKLETLKAIHAAGGKTYLQDAAGFTFMHYFFQVAEEIREDVFEFFKESIDLNIKNAYQHTAFQSCLMAGYFIPSLITDFNINLRDKFGSSPLFTGLKNLDETDLKAFLECLKNNTDMELAQIKDFEGNNILMCAIKYAGHHIPLLLEYFPREILVEENLDGLNPILMAACYGNYKTIKLIWDFYFDEEIDHSKLFLDFVDLPLFDLLFIGNQALNEDEKNNIIKFINEKVPGDFLSEGSVAWSFVLSAPKLLGKVALEVYQKELESLISRKTIENQNLLVDFWQNKNIPPLLLDSFGKVYFSNPNHVDHFSEILGSFLEENAEELMENQILKTFLSLHVDTIYDSEIENAITIFPPFLNNSLRVILPEGITGYYFEETNTCWISLAGKKETIISSCIHEWAHRVVRERKISLSDLIPYWEKLKSRFNQGEIRWEYNMEINLDINKSNMQLIGSIVMGYPVGQQLEEFFVRILETMIVPGNHMINCLKVNLPEELRDIEDVLLNILSPEPVQNLSFLAEDGKEDWIDEIDERRIEMPAGNQP